MSKPSAQPVKWKRYLKAVAGDIPVGGLKVKIATKYVFRLYVNYLLRYINYPPVPIPDIGQCLDVPCEIPWLKTIELLNEKSINTAVLSSYRNNNDDKEKLRIYINGDKCKKRSYYYSLVAHEITHALFTKKSQLGHIIQYMELHDNISKQKAEWLVKELSREIILPTRLLHKVVNNLTQERIATLEIIRLARLFSAYQSDLLSQLLHANVYLDWLKMPNYDRYVLHMSEKVRKWMAALIELKHMNNKNPLLTWSKQIVIIITRRGHRIERTRKYIGKLWGKSSKYTPALEDAIHGKNKPHISIDKIIKQCISAIEVENSQRVHGLDVYYLNPIIIPRIIENCPEIAKIIKGYSKIDIYIELVTRKISDMEEIYIIIGPRVKQNQYVLNDADN